jgi:hypothetical protein
MRPLAVIHWNQDRRETVEVHILKQLDKPIKAMPAVEPEAGLSRACGTPVQRLEAKLLMGYAA